ncbi:hypothetical protein NFC73_04880 [Pseudarthrobacter sp. RMG13]|uniref:Uncharacterized protein n=1 Tax=Pseudarthrobacter humi TaxID=2952523 RepID=A0ABT1LKU5_9MICC|nr:hypothetical protein [Pseudarthrobacter humi]MCP8999075.1 hypothetical protein [Pseudarthrobacter humi]
MTAGRQHLEQNRAVVPSAVERGERAVRGVKNSSINTFRAQGRSVPDFFT